MKNKNKRHIGQNNQDLRGHTTGSGVMKEVPHETNED